MKLLAFVIVVVLPLVQGQGGAPGLPGGYGGAPGLPGLPGGFDLSDLVSSSSGENDWVNLLLRQYLAEESKLYAKRKQGYVGSFYYPSEIYPFYFPMYFPIHYGAGGGRGGSAGMPGQPGYRK